MTTNLATAIEKLGTAKGVLSGARWCTRTSEYSNACQIRDLIEEALKCLRTEVRETASDE